MITIVLLGTGNLAKHLFEAFSATDGAQVVQVVGRNMDSLSRFSKMSAISNDFSAIADVDVYIIAVNDDAIGEVSGYLLNKKGVVVHASGAAGMDSIKVKNRGVFYPLQTFTEGKTLDFTSIPICIEAEQYESKQLLKRLAETISDNVQEIDSNQRKKLHLAAVFVNNFTNYLYGVGEEICWEEGLSFDLLKPLILETAEKIQFLRPKEAQTGPAKRGDKHSMQQHLNLLRDKKQIELYTLISEAIQQAYEKKL
ncbi:MAG: Rossmann-like and DUF2520 domain-containing protein [Allomuricauda sp.]